MRLLLDTHALMWFALDDKRLPQSVKRQIESKDSEVLVSAVTFYEIAFKRRRGRLPTGLPTDIGAACVKAGFLFEPVSPEDAEHAGALPEHHRDPWDRVLVAQAMRRSATLITKDPELAAYGVPILW